MDALTERVRALEDRAEIVGLLTSYGPAIDAGDAAAVAEIWTVDGIYDVDTGVMRGRSEIEAMVRGGRHQGYVEGGCAHIIEPALVVVDGDTAVATGKSLLVTADGPGGAFTVTRATANRWELIRTGDGWRCSKRIGRLLDGRSEARRLLAGEPPRSSSHA